MIDIEKNQKEIINELNKVDREGMPELVGSMFEKGFFTAPCSGGNHLACEGGLAEHSLNVLYAMRELNEAWTMELDEESIILCALLHDLGKANRYGKPNYVPNILKSGKISEAKPFESNKELIPEEHEIFSAISAAQCVYLSEEEIHAILHHNGLWGKLDSSYSSTFDKHPLSLALHFADLYCSRLVEV